jgi:hypothetical protein
MESKRAMDHEISEAISTHIVNPTLAMGIALGRLEGTKAGWADGYRQGQQEIIAGALEAILTARFGVLLPPCI